MPPDLEELLAPIHSAVAAASDLCLAVADGDIARIEKTGREPVTIADCGSQAIVLKMLSELYPEDRVLAEERSEVLVGSGDDVVDEVVRLVSAALHQPCSRDQVLRWIDHSGGAGSRTWAVDPIDGTKGFLRGDQFAVAVGVIEGGTAIGGILGCPRLEVGGAAGVIAWGGPGFGAELHTPAGRAPLSVSPIAEPGRTRVLGSVESAHGDPRQVEGLIDHLGLGGGWVRIDSQAKYVAVAAGLAEIYIRPRNRPEWRERVWDHAAGAALVSGAGGRVTDLDGRPLDFSLGTRLEANRGVIATNGLLHDSAVAVLGG